MSAVLQLTSCVYILGSFFIHIELSTVFTEYIMKPLEIIGKIKGNTIVPSHQRQHCVLHLLHFCFFAVCIQCFKIALFYWILLCLSFVLEISRLLIYLSLSLLYSFRYQV